MSSDHAVSGSNVRYAPSRGRFGISVKSGHKLNVESVRKDLPLRTMKTVFYLLERMRFFGSHRRNHFRTFGRKATDRAGRGPLRGTETQYQAIGIKCVLARRRPCDHFLHLSRTYPQQAGNDRECFEIGAHGRSPSGVMATILKPDCRCCALDHSRSLFSCLDSDGRVATKRQWHPCCHPIRFRIFQNNHE